MAYGRGLFKRARSFDSRRLAIAAGSLVLIAMAAVPLASLLDARANSGPSLERQLEREGFDHLTVSGNPAGGLIVSGMVAGETDMMRLRALTAAHGQPVLVDVVSSAAIASAATDILHAQGLEAKAAPMGLTGIMVTAPFLPADRQDQLSSLLQRDLPGVEQVAFEVDDGLGGSPLQSFFASSGTGLASVIDDPGHIVTADGARWFPGAVLPTGHRLISVEHGHIRFEKDGRVEEINP